MVPIVLSKVLSCKECQAVLKETEAVHDFPLPDTYNIASLKVAGLYNNIEDEDKADEIFARIRKCIPPDIIPGWSAIGVNENFRILKYLAGEDFPIHVDPDYSRPFGHPQYGNVSFLTLIVYLNDNFTGGDTVFYTTGPDLAKPINSVSVKQPSTDSHNKSEYFRICPTAGTAVLFKHSIYHCGEKVLSGVKYTLRTDLMFTSTNGS